MGSPKNEKGRFDSECPQREVRPLDYYLGVHVVTRGQFRAFVDDTGYKTKGEADGTGRCGWDGKEGKTDAYPVVLVDWNNAVQFCTRLSHKDEKTYQLPSKAQWEYACRTDDPVPLRGRGQGSGALQRGG